MADEPLSDSGRTDPPYAGVDDLLYDAWTVIANARGWDDNDEWRAAAIRWRDRWHAYLDWARHE